MNFIRNANMLVEINDTKPATVTGFDAEYPKPHP